LDYLDKTVKGTRVTFFRKGWGFPNISQDNVIPPPQTRIKDVNFTDSLYAIKV